ncbi:Aminotransferase family protein LolT, partial [Aspergillus sclerotialis]
MPEPIPFGAPMLQNFQFDPTFKNLNHGSFGTHPKQIQTLLRTLQSNAESRPDPFLRYEQPALIDAARSAIARYLNVPVNECVFVKNATTGVNTVLRNLVFSPGDVIIYFDTVYGGVGKTIQALEETTPAKGREVGYEFPITHDELVEKFCAEVKKVKSEGGTPKVAVFETVVSVPGIRFPFEDLVRVCRDEGVLSLVDGAHGVGMFKLDLKELGADFFTSNCHKWLFTPRSSAVLHVPSKNQSLIRTTLPTSWGFVPASFPESKISLLTLQETSKTRFEQLFEFVATADDSPYLTVPAAFEFRANVCGGEERIFAYLDELANAGGDIVASKLGTEVLQEVDGLAGGSAA